jgi:hypothetical protein
MTGWAYSQSRDAGGYFVVVFSVPGKVSRDVTYYRNVPVEISSYSSGDPFSDAVASLRFPQITGFDDFGTGDLEWLNHNASVDIYYIDAAYDVTGELINSLTQVRDQGYDAGELSDAVFQGFVASFDLAGSESDSSLSVQCQGALFQLDRMISKPFYPARPYLHEALIQRQLNPKNHPSLRTKALGVPQFPVGWTKKMPSGAATVYTPVGAKPGQNIVGFWTRQTGDFSRALTGYIQDLLAVMFVQEGSGVKPGDKWTLGLGPDRTPFLKIRSSDRAVAPPDFELFYGQLGADMNLSSDISQATNVIYGEGTGIDGVEWRNTIVSGDGKYTEYVPLASNPQVYPENTDINPNFVKGLILNESYIRYGSGMGEDQAIAAAEKQLQQFADPGWAGSINLSIDPTGISRWRIKAGMNVLVRNLVGSGSDGVMLHIAEASQNPSSGTVSLKVDSKYRDLLTLEEVFQRTRDPLTPAKLLRVNRRSIPIEDMHAPWNYNAGSGYMPYANRNFFKDLNANDHFPWKAQARKYPPRRYPQYYVSVNANARKRADRWKIGKYFPILLSEKGSARLLQIAAYDLNGNPVKVEFHFSLYYVPVVPNDMPRDKNGPSPFITGAFYSSDPTGVPWPKGYYLSPQPTMIEGWGNKEQPAGYSPGRKSDGYAKTGLLIDEGSWSWDFPGNNPEFVQNTQTGKKNPPSAYTAYGAIYCEYPQDVYFVGRIYRVDPS